MARTRGEIITLVKHHVGWIDRTDKDTLIDSLMNSALKYAIMEQDFRDLTTVSSGEAEITTGATSVDLSTFDPTVYKIISARLLRVANTQSSGFHLPLKSRKWWDKFIVDESTHIQGIPRYGLRVKDTLNFDRPIEDDWKLRLRYSSINTYTTDETETPSELLDLFVEYKVTADLFFSLEDMEKFQLWNRRAIGNNPEFPGGELGRAIRADEREAAKEHTASRGWDLGGPWGMGNIGIMTQDLNWTAGDEHNEYRPWV